MSGTFRLFELVSFVWPALEYGFLKFNLVKKVAPDNPAQQAGIRPGDIVLGIKKDKVEDPFPGNLKNSLATGSVIEQTQSLLIGKSASIIISRNGQELALPITATHPPPPLPKHSRILNTWVSVNINDLTGTNLGYPTRSFTAPNGNTVYEYARSK